MAVILTQHSLPPFKPLTSFLAYATGDEEITLKENSVAKIEKLTPEQEGRLVAFREEWRQVGICCDPADFAAGDEVIRGFYARIGKPAPVILHFSSPAMCELALHAIRHLIGKAPNQLWDQLGDQLRDQLMGQLWGQLRGQLGDQLWDQLWGQLRDQLMGQLWDQLRGQLWGQLRDQRLPGDFYRYSFDNQWNVAWGAFYLFGHEIGVKYKAEDIALLLEWGRLFKSVGWWAPFEGVCLVSDRPKKIHFDGGSRPHSEVGQAIEYSDGWGLHAWHGRRVPAEWIENRKTIDPAIIIKHENVEMRAVGAEIIGWSRMMDALGAKVIDSDPNPDHGDLIELTLPGLREPGLFLRAYCKRNGLIVEGVPRVSDIDGKPIKTVRAAQAWSFGKPEVSFQYPDHVS